MLVFLYRLRRFTALGRRGLFRTFLKRNTSYSHKDLDVNRRFNIDS